MTDAPTVAVRALLKVDVVDKAGRPDRIAVGVTAEVPQFERLPPLVGRFRLAGNLKVCGDDWPRGPERGMDLHGFRGETYRAWDVADLAGQGAAADDVMLSNDEVEALGVKQGHHDYAPYHHAATGEKAPKCSFDNPFLWDPEELAERYDLKWAAPIVGSFEKAVADRVIMTNDRLLLKTPMPCWWAIAEANEVVLDDYRIRTRYRNADLFPIDALADARRYLEHVPTRRGRPRQVLGGIDFLDPAWPLPDGLDEVCRSTTAYVSRRFERYLQTVPTALVHHYHDAANYTDGSVTTTPERVAMLSALGELLRRGENLPPTRMGEWETVVVDALLVRIHEIEGVPRYAETCMSRRPQP